MFLLTRETIIEDRLKQLISDQRAGAVLTFDGRVRNHNDGKAVTGLLYEAYEELAIGEAQKIIDEALEQFDILHVACAHRTGELKIGDVAVLVAVSAAHRDQAFQACLYVIDQIKSRLPIWKKENYVDGTAHWVNCQTCHAHAGERFEEAR